MNNNNNSNNKAVKSSTISTKIEDVENQLQSVANREPKRYKFKSKTDFMNDESNINNSNNERKKDESNDVNSGEESQVVVLSIQER
jgi:hypothetical protein